MPGSRSDYEKLAAFRYALRRFLRFSERAAASVGLTPQQHQALLAIEGFPGGHPVSISALAERLQLTHHAVVGLIDRLEREGLARRSPGAGDKRKVWVAVTSRGRKLLSGLTRAHKEQLTRLAPEMIEALESLNGPVPPKPRKAAKGGSGSRG